VTLDGIAELKTRMVCFSHSPVQALLRRRELYRPDLWQLLSWPLIHQLRWMGIFMTLEVCTKYSILPTNLIKWVLSCVREVDTCIAQMHEKFVYALILVSCSSKK